MTEDQTVFTYCRICEAACGLAVTVRDNRVLRIAPDKENPQTWQDFCAKGRTAGQVVEHPLRLLHPMRRVGDRYVEATWDEAVQDIASRLHRIIDRDGADAVGFYAGNPWGFSGSNPFFYAALQDAVGSQSRFSVGSIDQNNLMVVAEQMYGSSLLNLIPDVDECRFFLLVGMNPADSAFVWVGSVPNGWRRVLDAQRRGAEVVVVDPRCTPTAEAADQHLAIRPGADWALLLGMVKTVLDNGWEHAADCGEVVGMDDLRALVAAADLDDLSARCDLPREVIVDLARRFSSAPTAMCVSRTGVSLHPTGTIGEWLCHVLNLITGRTDRPGGRRFEPGYVDLVRLTQRLVPSMDARSRVHGTPAVWGHHSLAELPDEILVPGRGQIRALIINAGNPVVMGPDGARLDEALASLELLVAIDLVQRESHRHADWLIPAAHWLERDELAVVRGALEDTPFVQYGRRAVERPPDVREEWEFLVDLALEMRVPLFGKRGVNSFIRATRVLARITRRPGLAFRPQWIHRLLVAMGRKVRWRDIVSHPHGFAYEAKTYGHLRRTVCTPDRKIHAAPKPLLDEVRRQLAIAPASPAGGFTMISRRTPNMMNSWLMDIEALRRSAGGDSVEVNPDDAERLGIGDGDLVEVASDTTSVELRVVVSRAVRPGVVVTQQGWGSAVLDPTGGSDAERHGVNRNLLVAGRDLDPLSGTPALNGTRVELRAVERAAKAQIGQTGT